MADEEKPGVRTLLRTPSLTVRSPKFRDIQRASSLGSASTPASTPKPGTPLIRSRSVESAFDVRSPSSPRDLSAATENIRRAASLQSLKTIRGRQSPYRTNSQDSPSWSLQSGRSGFYSPHSFTFSPSRKYRSENLNIEDTLSGKWDTLSFASPHSAALGLNVAPDTYDQYLRSKSLRRGGKRRGFILDPTTSNFRKFWDVMLAVLIVYNALAVPLRLGFDLPGDVFLFWFDLFTDSLFIFDIILNFRTAMESAGVLIDKPSEIAREYLRTWFVIDVVSAFPIDLVLLAWGISPGKNSSSYRVNKLLKILKTFRLIKVFRLARLARIMARFRAIFNVRYSTSTIFKFFIAVAFVAHWIACFWYFVAVLEGLDNITWVSEMRMPDADVEGTLRHEELRTKYIVCIDHAIMVMSTIGSHILPVTNAERTYSLLTMFLGSSIYAYGITNGIYLIYNLNRAEVEYKQRMDAINDFMCTRHMPAELRNKVRQYYEHLHNKQRFFNEHEIIGELSRDL